MERSRMKLLLSKFPEHYKAKRFQYRTERRLRIINHYGGRCEDCGESDYRFLEIDHIDGGGVRHIKEIRKQGFEINSWIIKNGYPSGFRILCGNCNWIKRLEKIVYKGGRQSRATKKCDDAIRKRTFDVYGTKCVCCGYDDVRSLTIDHIDGEGYSKTKRNKYGVRCCGIAFYRVLKKMNYPKDNFQVLCRKCNQAKKNNTICPHTTPFDFSKLETPKYHPNYEENILCLE